MDATTNVIRRTAVVATLAAVGLLCAAAPAAAVPSGIGWSGNVSYPASGTLTTGSSARLASGTLTDTTGGLWSCARAMQLGANYEVTACGTGGTAPYTYSVPFDMSGGEAKFGIGTKFFGNESTTLNMYVPLPTAT